MIQGRAALLGFSYGHTSRATFKTWAANNTVQDGTVAFVKGAAGSSLGYVKNGTTTDIPDIPGWTFHNFMHLDHFRSTTSTTDTNTAFVNAFAYLNANGGTLYLPAAANVNITQPPPAIIHDDVQIIGQETRWIYAATGSGTNGNFLKWGSDTVTVNRCKFSGITFQCNNTPASTEFGVIFWNCQDVQFDNLGWANMSGIACYGWDTTPGAPTKAQRVIGDFGNGNFNKGLNNDAIIRIKYQAACIISGTLTGAGVCNTNANGAIVLVKPVAGGLCDTLTFTNFKVQAFSNSTPGSADGKPYGVRFDATDAPIVNILPGAGNVCDHTTVAAISFVDGAGSTGNCRDIDISGWRMAADNGRCFDFVKSSPSTALWVGVKVNDCHAEIVSNEHMRISGAGINQWIVTNATFQDTTATVKSRSILVQANGGLISDCAFGPNTTASTGIAAAVEIDAAVTDITVKSNSYAPGIAAPVKYPTAWTTPNSPRRVIETPYTQRVLSATVPVTGTDIRMQGGSGATSTLIGVANQIHLQKRQPTNEMTVTGFKVAVTTGVASALGRLVIYDSDNMGRPNVPVFTSADIDLSAIATVTVNGSFTFQNGVTYWLGFHHSSTATVAIWPAGSATVLDYGAAGTGAPTQAKFIRRNAITFGGASYPSPWVWNQAELFSGEPQAIWGVAA